MLSTLISLFCLPAPSSVSLLFTSDLHGRTDNLEKHAPRFRDCMDCLIVDSGDTLQGNSEAFATQGSGMVAAMNALGYHGMALGNHDFDWGLAALKQRQKEARFPLLSANIQGLAGVEPYRIVRTQAGIRVGLIGITTPYTPRWLPTSHTQGLTFGDPIEAVRRILPKVREEADVVVVLAHMGLADPPNDENPTQRLNDVPGIDLVLGGHTHQEVPLTEWPQTSYAQANKWGERVGSARLWGWPGHGRWQAEVQFHAFPQPPGHLTDVLSSYRQKAEQFNRTPVARLKTALPGSRQGPSPLLKLVHTALIQATGADLAFHDVASESGLPAGTVTHGDVFNAFPYENQVVVATLTGQKVKELVSLAEAHQGRWNFAGLSQPATPLQDQHPYRVATHSFLAAGGGGYTPFVGAPIEHTSMMVREAVLRHLKTVARP